jgi:hypothetical protein
MKIIFCAIFPAVVLAATGTGLDPRDRHDDDQQPPRRRHP